MNLLTIEARINSSRLPGKVMLDIEGKPAIQRLTERLSKSRIKSDKILLLTYGEINNFKIKSKNIKWLHLGTIESDYRMNLIYRSSDIMLNPSFDDLGPTTLQEAFLNNLYIVSFDLGLASDLIINNYNGNIVKNFDTDKFYQAVYKFILNRKSINKNISSQKTITGGYNQVIEVSGYGTAVKTK